MVAVGRVMLPVDETRDAPSPVRVRNLEALPLAGCGYEPGGLLCLPQEAEGLRGGEGRRAVSGGCEESTDATSTDPGRLTLAPRLSVLTPIPHAPSPTLDHSLAIEHSPSDGHSPKLHHSASYCSEATTPAESVPSAPSPLTLTDGEAPTAPSPTLASEVTTPDSEVDGSHWSVGSPREEARIASPDGDEQRDGVAAADCPPPVVGAAEWALGPDGLSCGEVMEEAMGEESEDHEDAVMALLGLARAPPVPPTSHSDPPELSGIGGDLAGAVGIASFRAGVKRRAADLLTDDYAPSEAVRRYSPMPKPDGSGEAKFFCKFPKCGKGYASTDAVRARPKATPLPKPSLGRPPQSGV